MSKQEERSEVFGEAVYVYMREAAIADGALVDVSETAREAGFRCSVALTSKLWVAVEAIPTSGAGAYSDVAGRLWDVLWMAFLAAKRARSSSSDFVVILPFRGTRKRNQSLRMVAGPGDAAELVITIGFSEDEW